MPPQKLASKIAELSGKIFTKNNFLLFDIISRTRLYWDFSKKSGVSLKNDSAEFLRRECTIFEKNWDFEGSGKQKSNLSQSTHPVNREYFEIH